MSDYEQHFDVEVSATAQVNVKKTIRVKAMSAAEAQMLAEAVCASDQAKSSWRDWSVDPETVRNLSAIQANMPNIGE